MKLITLTTLTGMKTSLTDRRLRGERRWGLQFEFPLRDSSGILVISERRTSMDRRIENTSLEDRLILFASSVSTASDRD